MKKNIKFLILLSVVLAVTIVAMTIFSACRQKTAPKSQTNHEELFSSGFPRAFFFRGAEGAAHAEYEDWNKTFSRLGGIIGKCLEEEVPGRSLNIPIFTRFKKEHPEQLVLLHYNGNGRDPRDNSHKFHAAHWLYYEGSMVMDDLPADTGITEIRVEDVSLFKANIGRYENTNEDIGICRLTEEGKPDWDYAEQVQLLGVDTIKSIIRIRRACYGSKPLAFKGESTLASAHVTEGPWGERGHLLWFYNHSSSCPRDTDGKTCNDIIVSELGEKFSEDGELGYFDGLEFDVLWNHVVSNDAYGRGIDTNGDGMGDEGMIGGVNRYSIGVYEFCRDLREVLGPDRLIIADGWSSEGQRITSFLNGIESEGWPMHKDPQIKDWSGGWNRHMFWNLHAFEPRFSFVNFKYTLNVRRRGEVPPVAQQRLVWAVAQMLDARFTHSGYPVEKPKDGIYTEIIDEVVGGIRQEKYWLGQPEGPAVRLALKNPDVLGGAGQSWQDDFLSKWSGEMVDFANKGNEMKVSSDMPEDMHFNLSGIPCTGPDLLVSVEFRCDPRKNYPDDMPRLIKVYSSENDYRLMSFISGEWFHATFYFRDITGKSLDLFFEMESNEPIWIRNLTAHTYPDVVYRIFENGLVLGNPSHHEYTFNLDSIASGRKYRRLTATPGQDTEVNNGMPVGPKIKLGAKEGIFLEL